jgi:hypothetical protein
MIQGIHNTTNDAHNTLTEHSEHLLNTFTKEMQNHMPKQSQPVQPTNYIYNTSPSRFGHTYRRSPTPFDSSNSLPDYNHNRHHQPSTYTPDKHMNMKHHVPVTVNIDRQQQHHDLPPLNHDQAVKRAKIQFTGQGDMFVFYNQLMNGMEQFGIFLIPLSNVGYNIDLCPL